MDDSRLAELLAPPVARTRRVPRARRRAWLTVLALAASAALGAGGWQGTGWLRDADLRGALSVSTGIAEQLVSGAERARSSGDLAQLATDAEPARGRLARAERRAQRVGRRGADVVAALAAQQRVLAALRPLESMGYGPLQVWGRVRAPLQQALAAEVGTRRRLTADRPEVARRLASYDLLLPSLDRAGTPLLEQAARAELRRLAGVLSDARTTADLRAAADVAIDQRVAVRRTSDTAPTLEPVARCSDVVDALSGLQELSSEDVSAWPPVRALLRTSLGDEAALAHADGLVQRAEEAGVRWRGAVAVAGTVRERDDAALTAHMGGVRGLTAPWGQLDVELGRLLAALVLRPPGAAERAQLAELAGRYDTVVAALSGAAAPRAVAPEHVALVRAATIDAEAVAALAREVGARPGRPLEQARRRFDALAQRRSAASAARTSALAAWESGVRRAAALVAVRPLPEPPLV